MNKTRDLLSKTLVVGVIVLFVGLCVQPTTANVNNSSGYIQDLIDNASDGDIIYIPSGIYYENIIIDKSISLIGEDKNSTIIDGSGIGDVIKIIADNVYISEFTIRNCSSLSPYNDAGVSIKSNYNTIIDNIITLNNENGIRLSNSKYNEIKSNIITLNIRDGIEIVNSNFNIIENNTITLNKDDGVIFVNSKRNTIKDNTISRNKEAGIGSVDSRSNIIERNIISLNHDGVLLSSCNYNKFKKNRIFNNKNGMILANCHFTTISNNIIDSNNHTGITIKYLPYWLWGFVPKMLHSRFNIVMFNNISNNGWYGVFLDYSNFNYFIKNNFQDNREDAYFKFMVNNRWKRNYWSKPRVFPKLIFGIYFIDLNDFNGFQVFITWFNIDWFPAKEPYDIGV